MARPRKIAEDGIAVVEGFNPTPDAEVECHTGGKLYLKKNGVTRRFDPSEENAKRSEGWE